MKESISLHIICGLILLWNNSMIQRYIKNALKALLPSKTFPSSEQEIVPENAVPESNVVDLYENQPAPLPRYLLLARTIHAHFTYDEEKEMAVYKAAETLAARKNEVIMRAVEEVIDFCDILREAPALNEALDKKTEDITERLFSNRSSYTIEHDPITVQYQAPVYRVDMHVPEHISLSCADNAFLHISFNPVKFVLVNSDQENAPTITKHLLIKQYRLNTDGDFLHFQSHDGSPADPIADIITELRAKLGREFFDVSLIPHLEAQAKP